MRLLAPIALGRRTAPNRLLFGPHVTNLGRGRGISDRHVAYYARRARGGTGIIVAETASVHDSDWPYERAPLAAESGDGWRAVAEACHGHGPVLVLASLGHAGGQGSSAHSQRELWAPSAVAEVNTREMPKVMETEDIAATVASFAHASRLAAGAGMDGVEVNAGQHSLVRQFLSGLTNRRSDAYGADRTLFAREVLAAARLGLGPGGLLGLRLCVDELAPWAGITPEQAVPLALELAPLVDYMVLVRGSIYSVAATRPDGHTPPGFNLPATAAVRSALARRGGPLVPVFLQGSIVDAGMAEAAVAAGDADGVEMTRAQIADPLLARKLAAGGPAPRPCVLCNQTCQVLDDRNPLVTCIGEPASGHESEDPDLDSLPDVARGTAAGGSDGAVLVIGGGPAGLECARVAAALGRRVRLCEQSPVLGGRLRTAAIAPGRERLAALAGWLESECRRLGVEIVTGRRVSSADAAAHRGPVVCCSGSRDGEPDYAVEPGSRVLSAEAFLASGGSGAGVAAVVVWDPVGGPIGVSVAELAARHATTTLVTPDQTAGTQLTRSGDLVDANTRLQSAGVEIVRRAVLRRAGDGEVEIEDRFGAGASTRAASLLVDAGHRLPSEPLPGTPTVAGDAVAPRTVHEAVLEGRRARARLGELTSSRYPLLFSPMRIGPVVVANRVVFAAHLTNYAGEGLPTDQHAAYYEARAAGGAGLVITEEHSTHETDWPYEKMIHGFRPDALPGYRRITEAVHRHGTPIFAQINHNGGQGSGMYSRLPVWSASPVADPMFREVAKAVEGREITEIVAGYTAVAGRCVEGGFDGLELQCSHSSIVRCFLSRATNRRFDRYGGALANRARLLLEILAAVREAVGRHVAVGVRLCGDELIEGGITIEETVEVARLVEATGHCDYVNTSIGVATASLYMIEASMAVPPGYALFIPSALRKAVALPVVGSGRFKDPLQAERALREGHVDLVGIVRGQIADPDFAAKARAGAAEEIRLCLSCNQECVGRVGQNRWLGCIENPATGREADRRRPRRSSPAPAPAASGGRGPLRVIVAGAGPAGLQAAIAAASRGHDVTVYERETEPGGQIRLAARAPFRSELGDLIRNQLAECRRLGVEMLTGVTVDAPLVTRGPSPAPDLVVVATGARPAPPWWAPAAAPPGDGEHVGEGDGDRRCPRLLDVTDVLGGGAEASGRVLVVDELGFHQATSVAELLADRGCTVELMTPGMVSGQDLGTTLDLETWWMRASARGIVQTTDTIVTGLAAGGVETRHLPTGRAGERQVDFVVLAVQQAPADELYLELKELARLGTGPPVRRVGDCLAPRRAHAAVVDGERVGEILDGLLPRRHGTAARRARSVIGAPR